MPAKTPASEFLNKTFSLLTIIEDLGFRKGGRFVLAKCECGAVKGYRYQDVKRGGSTNCGCVRKSKVAERNNVHGLSKHKLYRVWRGMIERCDYKKHNAYKWYGGRGITVCQEWRNDFMLFYNWSLKNGWHEGLEVDRRENDGNYSPDNCRVVTKKVNSRNTSQTIYLEYNGERRPQSEWAEIMGISYDVLSDRVKYLGWSVEKALTTPLDDRVKRGRAKKCLLSTLVIK